MDNLNYTCPKCGNRTCTIDQFRATGSYLAKVFDIQSKKFTTVSCERCTYTEIYKAESSQLGNIFDFFTG